MSVNIRLAKPEDQRRCSELLNVLAEATLEPYEIFNSDAFSNLISIKVSLSHISAWIMKPFFGLRYRSH
jgi:hypothetical protein